MEQERPELPWAPLNPDPIRDEFESGRLALKWHTVRTPVEEFYRLGRGKLSMQLRPQVVDSLVNSSILIKPTRHFKFSATTKLSFTADEKKEIVAEVPYNKPDIFFNVEVDKLNAQFRFGESLDNMVNMGEVQSMVVLAENNINKFNGTGIGVYASGNGQKSKNKATFDWFEYKFKK